MERNLEAFERFTALLGEGRVTAIFPEGLTQDEPHLSPVKTGAARIALQAEDAAGFTLKLTVVPVGLQFEPRRRFRADAFVRFGEPFTISDLAPTACRGPAAGGAGAHGPDRRGTQAVSPTTSNQPNRSRSSNGSPTSMLGARAEPVSLGYGAGGFVANCCKESLRASTTMPGPTRKAVEHVERALAHYERLRERAGHRPPAPRRTCTSAAWPVGSRAGNRRGDHRPCPRPVRFVDRSDPVFRDEEIRSPRQRARRQHRRAVVSTHSGWRRHVPPRLRARDRLGLAGPQRRRHRRVHCAPDPDRAVSPSAMRGACGRSSPTWEIGRRPGSSSKRSLACGRLRTSSSEHSMSCAAATVRKCSDGTLSPHASPDGERGRRSSVCS